MLLTFGAGKFTFLKKAQKHYPFIYFFARILRKLAHKLPTIIIPERIQVSLLIPPKNNSAIDSSIPKYNIPDTILTSNIRLRTLMHAINAPRNDESSVTIIIPYPTYSHLIFSSDTNHPRRSIARIVQHKLIPALQSKPICMETVLPLYL